MKDVIYSEISVIKFLEQIKLKDMGFVSDSQGLVASRSKDHQQLLEPHTEGPLSSQQQP